jgi:hypothetical protein
MAASITSIESNAPHEGLSALAFTAYLEALIARLRQAGYAPSRPSASGSLMT